MSELVRLNNGHSVRVFYTESEARLRGLDTLKLSIGHALHSGPRVLRSGFGLFAQVNNSIPGHVRMVISSTRKSDLYLAACLYGYPAEILRGV
jgi:hypothetical protein